MATARWPRRRTRATNWTGRRPIEERRRRRRPPSLGSVLGVGKGGAGSGGWKRPNCPLPGKQERRRRLYLRRLLLRATTRRSPRNLGLRLIIAAVTSNGYFLVSVVILVAFLDAISPVLVLAVDGELAASRTRLTVVIASLRCCRVGFDIEGFTTSNVTG